MKWTDFAYVCVSMVVGLVVYQLFQRVPSERDLAVAVVHYTSGALAMFIYAKWFDKGERGGD